MDIESLVHDHWPQVRSIYERGIAFGNATFQASAPIHYSSKEEVKP